MYARVTTLEASPDRVDDATRHVRDQVLPQLQQQEGFKGLIALGDRQSGKVLGVALWDLEPPPPGLRVERLVGAVRPHPTKRKPRSYSGGA